MRSAGNSRRLRCTRIGRLLAGFRGIPPADLEALSRALAALSQFMLQFPQIQEVDLNPVRLAHGQPGLLALDARIKVGYKISFPSSSLGTQFFRQAPAWQDTVMWPAVAQASRLCCILSHHKVPACLTFKK